LPRISSLRITSQTLSFVAINAAFLGPFYLGIPLAIMSCNYLKLRIFDCFMYVLQDGLTTVPLAGTVYLYFFVEVMVLFLVMALFAGRVWCGWICPLGYVQDLLTRGRVFIGVGHYRIPEVIQKHVKLIKYLFLAIVIILSLGIALPMIRDTRLRNTLYLPLCQVCPARALFIYLQIAVGILPSNTDVPLLSIAVLPVFLVGAVVIRRGWCILCPNGAALSFFHKLNAFALFRSRVRCTKCGTCTRVCAMSAASDNIYGDVSRRECIRCLDCVEKCPEHRSRSVYFFGRRIVGSKFPFSRVNEAPTNQDI
jgi:polyferredoxin